MMRLCPKANGHMFITVLQDLGNGATFPNKPGLLFKYTGHHPGPRQCPGIVFHSLVT